MNNQVSVYIKKTYGEKLSSKELIMELFRMEDDSDIVYDEHGKPSLARGNLYISASHSGNYHVLAVAKCEVGVDIEPADRTVPDSVVERVFNDEEKEFIRFNPAQNGVFMWTRLEAALKLTGEGLAGIDRRTFMLYDEDEKIPDPIWYNTLRYGNIIISVAGYEPVEMNLIKVEE